METNEMSNYNSYENLLEAWKLKMQNTETKYHLDIFHVIKDKLNNKDIKSRNKLLKELMINISNMDKKCILALIYDLLEVDKEKENILNDKNNPALKYWSIKEIKKVYEEESEKYKEIIVALLDYVKIFREELEKQEKEKNIIELEKDFPIFQLTSKETDFQKYNTEIEIITIDKPIAKTKTKKIENNNIKNKKVLSKGNILCYLSSPLDWLNKEYSLTNENTLSKEILIGKIKATKHFELKAREIQIYNAICRLIKAKKYNNSIFITYNELHSQLGYTSRITEKYRNEYKTIIYKLRYLDISIDISEAKNNKYKNFYKMEGNIKEPLIIWHGEFFKKVRKNNITMKLEGFEVSTTKIMNLHFNHTYQTNHYRIENTKYKKIQNSQITQQEALIKYIKKLYHLQKNNKEQITTPISIKKLFEELKEFNFESQYNKAKESRNLARFMNRNIYNLLDPLEIIKTITKDTKHDNIIIYWNN